MTTAALDVPADVERSVQQRRPHGSSRPPLATMIKYLVFGALGVLVVIYIGPSEIGEMLLKIAVALVISTGLFVGANKLFDLTYDRWTLFSSIAGFAVGFLVFLVLDGNRLLRDPRRARGRGRQSGASPRASSCSPSVRHGRSVPGFRWQLSASPVSACSSPCRSTSRGSPAWTGPSCSCARPSGSASAC